MHTLYFVKLPKEEAEDSLDAGSNAYTILEVESFFNTGYFGSDKGDRGEVGGRFTGCLSLKDVDIDQYELEEKAILKELDTSERTLKLNQLWFKHTKSDLPHPDTRKGGFEYCGHEDDALMLDDSLLEFLHRRYKDTECFDAEKYEEGTVGNIISSKDVGKFWIVVIDYHY